MNATEVQATVDSAIADEHRRLKLWLHLTSEHAMGCDPFESRAELEDAHKHEHRGPGGIRNHPEDSRAFTLKKVGEVLSENEGCWDEEFDAEVTPS